MRTILAVVTAVSIGIGFLIASSTRADATSVLKSKSNVCNNRVTHPDGSTTETTTTFTETDTTIPDTACQLANKVYSEGAVFCNGQRIAMTCKEGKWVVGNPPTMTDVCKDAPFLAPQ